MVDLQENQKTGFISLFRSIKNHWIFKNDQYFKWWVLMLLEANFKDNKVVLGYDLYEIKRGECANSLRTWSMLFACSTKTVSKFFVLLEKDNMISFKKIGKGKHSTTLVNIKHYNDYQVVKETQDDHERKRKRLSTETQETLSRDTTNNVNKDNNVNKGNNRDKALDFLNKKIPSQYQSFVIQNKNNVYDWKSLTESFNDTIDLEIAQNKISFNENELMPRLRKFCRSWINNQKTVIGVPVNFGNGKVIGKTNQI